MIEEEIEMRIRGRAHGILNGREFDIPPNQWVVPPMRWLPQVLRELGWKTVETRPKQTP